MDGQGRQVKSGPALAGHGAEAVRAAIAATIMLDHIAAQRSPHVRLSPSPRFRPAGPARQSDPATS